MNGVHSNGFGNHLNTGYSKRGMDTLVSSPQSPSVSDFDPADQLAVGKYARPNRIQTEHQRKGSTTDYIKGYFNRNRRMSSSQSTTTSISSISTLAYTPSLNG